MDGQAQAPESGGLNDLVSFLDNPDEEPAEEIEADQDLVDESASDEITDDATNDDSDESDESNEETEEEAAPVEKITFKVKGEDGVEETVEATPEEIASSYMQIGRASCRERV